MGTLVGFEGLKKAFDGVSGTILALQRNLSYLHAILVLVFFLADVNFLQFFYFAFLLFYSLFSISLTTTIRSTALSSLTSCKPVRYSQRSVLRFAFRGRNSSRDPLPIARCAQFTFRLSRSRSLHGGLFSLLCGRMRLRWV